MRRLLRQLAESGTAFREVFANPGLRRIELAWAASILGTWAYGIAVVVYAYDHGGATAVGVVGLARWLAAAVASPFAALLRGRYDPPWVMGLLDPSRVLLVARATVVGCSPASGRSRANAGCVSSSGCSQRRHSWTEC